MSIPVLYIKREAFRKHCSDESAIIDIALNVSTKTSQRIGTNIIGYADNRADSTIIASAHMDEDTDVAALIEVARLLKPAQAKNVNYLFIAYSGEQEGEAGINHFKQHPAVNLQQVNYTINLDTVTVANENPNGLHLVKRSIELIKN